MAVLIRVDRNGTKYFEGTVPCDRCGGAGGADKWALTGWTCFKCGGSGKMQGKWKEYTPEYETKLEARRLARHEKYEREHAEEIAKKEAERKAKEEAERLAKELEEQKLREQKALSQYIGQVGDKIEMDVVFDHRRWYDAPSFRGFGTERRFIYIFIDADDNAIVWKTSKGLVYEDGQKLHIKAVIKEHSEYEDLKQTVITRCRVEA